MDKAQIQFAIETQGEVFTPDGDAAQIIQILRWDRGWMDYKVETDEGVFLGSALEASRALQALPGYPA